jgi:SAM-dependent methyltransferase
MSEEMPGNTMELLATASGVVLDLGPGTGELLNRFSAELITKAYGPEPAVDMHPALQANIDKAGLHGKYKILTAGAEPNSLIPALAKVGLIKPEGLSSQGIFDTICATRVLCGIPDTEETVKELYRLLKPGGRIIVAEHVKSPWPRYGSILGFVWQKVLILMGWKLWMSGCTLNKNTLAMFKEAGGVEGWKDFDIRYTGAWHPLPFIVGTLTKA